MSNKQKPSKKAVREKKEKAIDDATFGLKNKNKSKKVQQFINRVEKSVKNSGGGAEQAKAKEAKKDAKLAKKIQEEELRELLGEGIANQFGKKKTNAASSASALGLTQKNEDVEAFLDNLSSDSENDSDDDDDAGYKRKASGPIYIDDAPVMATEVFREKTIEDLIEEQRAKLAAEGKKGTPVTAETFAAWKAAKLARKQEEAEARLKAEQTKKKGGKGLSVLSGKELFRFNSSLFTDDDAAIDASEEDAMSSEHKKLDAQEDAQQKAETERAQAEQQRLAEAAQIELQLRKDKEERRRQQAAAADRVMFEFNGVKVNQIVFEDDEEEDLTLFPEARFVQIDAAGAPAVAAANG